MCKPLNNHGGESGERRGTHRDAVRIIKEKEGRKGEWRESSGTLVTGNVWLGGGDATLVIVRRQSILLPPQRAGSKSGWHWVTLGASGGFRSNRMTPHSQRRWHLRNRSTSCARFPVLRCRQPAASFLPYPKPCDSLHGRWTGLV